MGHLGRRPDEFIRGGSETWASTWVPSAPLMCDVLYPLWTLQKVSTSNKALTSHGPSALDFSASINVRNKFLYFTNYSVLAILSHRNSSKIHTFCQIVSGRWVGASHPSHLRSIFLWRGTWHICSLRPTMVTYLELQQMSEVVFGDILRQVLGLHVHCGWWGKKAKETKERPRNSGLLKCHLGKSSLTYLCQVTCYTLIAPHNLQSFQPPALALTLHCVVCIIGRVNCSMSALSFWQNTPWRQKPCPYLTVLSPAW